jgi:amino acid transporter
LLIAGIGLLLPVGLLIGSVTLSSCIDYLSQLSAFGYILAYFFVCLAMPFYLRREHALAARHVALAVAALAVLGVVLVLSIFPVPPAPWRYLPYIFLASMVAALGVTALGRRVAV